PLQWEEENSYGQERSRGQGFESACAVFGRHPRRVSAREKNRGSGTHRVSARYHLPIPPYTRMRGFRVMNHQERAPANRKKKTKRHPRTAREKRINRKLAQIRVRVEHAVAGVKRSRIVKDTFRNTKENMSDASVEVACGLHNVRLDHRKHGLKL